MSNATNSGNAPGNAANAGDSGAWTDNVTIIGVGPGDRRLLTAGAIELLGQAEVVAGFRTVLEVVQPYAGAAELCPMSYRDQEAVLDYAVGQARAGRKLVVCAWGDLNVSARELLERVTRRTGPVALLPGISSVQVALSRAGVALEEAVFITLHRREGSESALAELLHYLTEGRRHIVLLPRPFDLMPPAIAAGLLDEGAPPEREMTIYQRLTLDGEQAWHGTLAQCAALTEEFSDLSIMVFRRPA